MAIHLASSTNDTVSFGDLAYMDGKSTLTITAWMKKDATSGRVVIGKGNTITNEMSILCNTDGNTYFIMRNGTTSIATIAFDNALWNYYAMVFDGAQAGNARCLCYINGVDQSGSWSATPAATTPTNARQFYAGLFERASIYSDGDFGEIRVYSEALTPQQIKTDYRGLIPIGTQGYWPLGLATSEPDFSGNFNYGTRNGSPAVSTQGPPIGPAWKWSKSEYLITPVAGGGLLMHPGMDGLSGRYFNSKMNGGLNG